MTSGTGTTPETVEVFPRTLTGGQINLSGILYQLVRTLDLGLDVIVRNIRHGPAGAACLLTPEPPDGGDARIDGAQATWVEQIKMRRGEAVWSAGEVAEKVLPDLMRGIATNGASARYRFTTDREAGLGELRMFLAAIASMSDDDPETALDDRDRLFRYGRVAVTARAMFDRIATRARISGPQPRRDLWRLLRRLELLVISEDAMVGRTDAILARLVDAVEDLERVRAGLIGTLFDLGRAGTSIAASRLLERHGLDARRLRHIGWLRASLIERTERDARRLGYREDEEARSSALRPSAAFSVLSGISGQGKTWTLCRSALADAGEGRQAILIEARGTLADIERQICARLWQPYYETDRTLIALSRRLRADLADEAGVWLSLYLDDLHDRGLARALAQAGWEDHGVRIVIAAQPRISEQLAATEGGTTYSVVDFTPIELTRYLLAANRDPLMIPDDVLDLLARPIFANIFVQLPESAAWQGINEYQLVEAYWRQATREMRDQADHGSDGWRLSQLAGSVLDAAPVYPWPVRVRDPLGLDDASILRLTQVGLVGVDPDQGLHFAHDRMLNWALAEWLCARALEGVDADDLQAMVERADAVATADQPRLGKRLGYVLLDLIWLLAHRLPPAYLARFLLAHMRAPTFRETDHSFFRDTLATIGPALVPALELALAEITEEDELWHWPRHFSFTFKEIGKIAPSEVRAACATMILSPSPAVVAVALLTLAKIPAPTLLDALWIILQERAEAYEAGDSDQHVDLRHARQNAADALLCAVREDIAWLARTIGGCDQPVALEQLLWIVIRLGHRRGRPLWEDHKSRFVAYISSTAMCLARAARIFRDAGRIDALERLEDAPDNFSTAAGFALDGLAAIAPDRALDYLRTTRLDRLWGTSHWWLPGLLHRSGDGVRAVLLARAAETEDPLRTLNSVYASATDLIDGPTLDVLLDGFTQSLVRAGETDAADRLEQQFRWLDLLAGVTLPELMSRFEARRGTELEQLLAEHATGRPGRSSNIVDHLAENARRILAMIAGEGYDRLALAELARPDPYGREEGFVTALWSEHDAVRAALAEMPALVDERDYSRLRRQHVLAAHGCDDAIDAMLSNPRLVSRNSVAIRRGRPGYDDRRLEALRDRLRGGGDTAEQAMRALAFASRPDVGPEIIDGVLDPDASDEMLSTGIGILDELGYYEPRLLPVLKRRLDHAEKAGFTATFMAWYGDADARAAVSDWLEAMPGDAVHRQELTALDALLASDDSRPAALRFLKRLYDKGALGPTSGAAVILAEAGDVAAIEGLERGAYQRSTSWRGQPIAAIRFLRATAPDEAFIAAERLFRRQADVAAGRELMQMNPDRGMAVLLDAYQQADTATRWWIGRILRWEAPIPLQTVLAEHAASSDDERRLMAADLAGWLPSDLPAPFLADLADDPSVDVEKAALASLRERRREAGARDLLLLLEQGPKPLRWARLESIVKLVDPHLLGHAADPLSLTGPLKRLPAEFRIEIEPVLDRSRRKVADGAAREDRDKER